MALTPGATGKLHSPACLGPCHSAVAQLRWKTHGTGMKLGRGGTGITWQLLTFSLHLLCQCERKQTTCEGSGVQ